MKRFLTVFLCICILMTIPVCAFAEETTDSSAPDKSDYEDGVLGWLEGIFDGFASLPSRIWDFLKTGFENVVDAIAGIPDAIAEALSFSEIMDLFDGFDFSPVTDFFTSIWEQFRTGFGLKDFIEDPEGPFGWLSDTATVGDDENPLKSGILGAFSAIGVVTGAIPSDITIVFTFIFCGFLVIAFFKAF